MRRCRLRSVRASGRGDSGGDGDGSEPAAMVPDRWQLYASLIALATVAALGLTYGSDAIQVSGGRKPFSKEI